MKHVMLDLETLGFTPGSVVVSIGAVKFDPFGDAPVESFYQTIDVDSSIRAGLTVEGETLLWWLRQGDEARRSTFAGDTQGIGSALVEFHDWFPPSAYVWSNGPAFDVSILEAAYRGATGIEAPWSHRRVVDCRTIQLIGDLLGIKTPKVEFPAGAVAHNAISDAHVQVVKVQSIFRVLRAFRPDQELLRMLALQASAHKRGTYPGGAEAVAFLQSDLAAIAGHVKQAIGDQE